MASMFVSLIASLIVSLIVYLIVYLIVSLIVYLIRDIPPQQIHWANSPICRILSLND